MTTKGQSSFPSVVLSVQQSARVKNLQRLPGGFSSLTNIMKHNEISSVYSTFPLSSNTVKCQHLHLSATSRAFLGIITCVFGFWFSPMRRLAQRRNHSADDLIILDSDDNWRSRGIRESVYIRALNPSLNRRLDRNDRYTLPATSIIKAKIKTPPAPLPHQSSERRTFTGDRRPGRQRRTTETSSAAAAAATKRTSVTTTIPRSVPTGHHMVTRRMARASAGDGDTPD